VLSPEWRGRGLGSALFADIVREAGAAGFARLTLSALRHDDAVQRFYRRLGFVATGGDEVHLALALDLDATDDRPHAADRAGS
jgi:ribosomal protein S18 acetylase RimI-like enzyme